MKRRTFLKGCTAGTAIMAFGGPRFDTAAEADTLEQAFLSPPPSAHARTWWHWMNGNISAVGITKDLEAMKRVGCSGFHLFQVGTGIPKGPVEYGSDKHLELLRHAAREAARLEMGFAMHNCPGWSSSGGPWITPELSMQVLTWTETPVSGGRKVSVTLPRPPARHDYYRDAMVLAMPSSAVEQVLPVKVSTDSGAADAKALVAARGTALEMRPPVRGGSGFLLLEYAEPLEARSLAVWGSPIPLPAGQGSGRGSLGRTFALEASDDGVQFRKVADIAAGQWARGTPIEFPATANFPRTRARYFRLVTSEERRVTGVRFSALPRIENWDIKANFDIRRPGGSFAATALDPGERFPETASVVDVGRLMDPQGRLDWDAPAGHWTVFRIGHTTTGVTNHPGPDGGVGLECDKFSKEAYEYHFDRFFGKLFDVIAPLAAKGLAGSIIDSYETGRQNWSAKVPEEFKKRRGYDLLKYIPAMVGRIVEDPSVSERFLWDVRKTQAELMEENYYGSFQEQCHKHGMQSFIEPYDPGNFDEMPAGRYADMVQGEFWLGQANHHSIKLVSSIGHVYDKQIIASESFTSQSKWQEHPYCMKTLGDFMYTQGLNNFVFHRFAHQPHPDAAPGMTMGPWGWYFDRTNTWFDKSDGWLKGYVARAQNLLRQGTFVGDLLYFTGEDSPRVAPPPAQLKPPPPPGYDWDTIDAGAVMTGVRIADGRIVVPGGTSYAALVLRDNPKLSLELLRKIRDLVNDGMNLVVNARPDGSPGLTSYPDCDSEVRRIAAEMWGVLNGTTVTERNFGRGQIFWGRPLQAVMDKLGIKPDFEFTSESADAPIHWIHRRTADADVYFVSNRRRRSEELVCTFRVSGKQPEFWDAVTGEIKKIALFESTGGVTRVPIRLGPAGSIFAVFRADAPSRRQHEITRNDTTLATTRSFATRPPGLYREVANNFTISLWVKPDMDTAMPNLGVAGAGYPGFRGGPSFVFYPPAGESLYGPDHAACGLVAGRNGVAVFERTTGEPAPVAVARVPIAGWTHLAVVYRDGAPLIYADGKQVGEARKSGRIVHPGLGEAKDAPADFMGQTTEPRLFTEPPGEARIQQLAAAGLPDPEGPPAFEPAAANGPELLFWLDGKYTLRDNGGRETLIVVSGLGNAMEIRGPWAVKFPPNLGAPPEITLQALKSLHRHELPGVKYFSGTATYAVRFEIPAGAMAGGKRLYLDLGRVEVIAEVKVNGKAVGNVWTYPYRLEVTDAARAGTNDLVIQVSNLWPNRLIGDEQLPPEYEYGEPGAVGTGGATGAILKIPEWYTEGEPKPPGKRVAFTTWKWYGKEDPLLESGLLGPVRLYSAVRRRV